MLLSGPLPALSDRALGPRNFSVRSGMSSGDGAAPAGWRAGCEGCSCCVSWFSNSAAVKIQSNQSHHAKQTRSNKQRFIMTLNPPCLPGASSRPASVLWPRCGCICPGRVWNPQRLLCGPRGPHSELRIPPSQLETGHSRGHPAHTARRPSPRGASCPAPAVLTCYLPH